MTDKAQPIQPAHWSCFVLFPAIAGAIAWGIRGQYGHETGAMIAGALIGFTIVLLLRPAGGTSVAAARAVALMAIGIGLAGR